MTQEGQLLGIRILEIGRNPSDVFVRSFRLSFKCILGIFEKLR